MVCLKSGVTLEKVGDNEYKLIAPPPATAADVAADPINYYGASVNYEDPAGDQNVGWKIFYADNQNIYLVASDYIAYDYTPKGKNGSTTVQKSGNNEYKLSLYSMYNVYEGSVNIMDSTITDSRVLNYLTWVNSYPASGNNNIRSVAYMVDTARWNEKYKNNVYADYAIGGPTVEMFIKSYNQIYQDVGLTYATTNQTGYYVGSGGATATSNSVTGLDTTNSLYVISDTNKCSYWWIASPSFSNDDWGVVTIVSTGEIKRYDVDSTNGGFRPVVCLKSDVRLQANADGTYNLVLPEITVKPNQSELTINPNDSHSFDSLFTVTTATGDTSGVTKTYKLNGAATEYNNTSNLALGEYTLTCTAKLENGASAVAAITIIVALGYTLTFLSQGATVATMTGVKTVSFPEEDPTLTNYKFTGWYYDEAATQIATVGDSITANTTLYAGWGSYVLNPNKGETLIERAATYKNGSILYLANDFYKYEGTSTISEIILDESTTTAEMFQAYWGAYVPGDITTVEKMYTYEEMESYFYSEGNKICFNFDALGFTYPYTYVFGNIGVKIIFEDGSTDTDLIYVKLYCENVCLAEGTQITLADRTTKAIEDITYEDDLLVWDFDRGEFATAKPLWIMKKQIAAKYNLLKFDNGSELKTIDQHRIFNKELGKFTYPMTDETPVGTTTFTDSGEETTLISKEVVRERVNYYNIITDYHMNLFANGILTSCRLSNLYKIENMKYVKDNRELIQKEAYPTVPQEYYDGLRLAEQPQEVNRGNDVEHSKDLAGYVQNLINNAKPKA